MRSERNQKDPYVDRHTRQLIIVKALQDVQSDPNTLGFLGNPSNSLESLEQRTRQVLEHAAGEVRLGGRKEGVDTKTFMQIMGIGRTDENTLRVLIEARLANLQPVDGCK